MRSKNAITVEGVMLDEFLKSHESISEDIERKKIIRDGNAPQNIYRHMKPRYKEAKEKNGKVRTLDIIEVNKEYYSEYLGKALKTNDLKEAFAVVVLCNYDKSDMDIFFIAEEITKYGNKNDIIISKKMPVALRAILGYIRKTVFSEYMYFASKRATESRQNRIFFGINLKKAKDLSLDDAIKLVKIKNTDVAKNSEMSNKNNSIQIKKSEVIEKTNYVKEPPQKKEDLVSTVIKALGEISKNNSLFKVDGDFHLHIHIDK